MPRYEFITEEDEPEIVELQLTMAEFQKRVKNDIIKLDDGRTAKVYWGSYATGRRQVGTNPSNYPMVSEAMGVLPSQVKAHMDHLRAMGCGQVNHTKDGAIIFEDKAQRKKVCEALGFFDRNGGYGDPQAKRLTSLPKRH